MAGMTIASRAALLVALGIFPIASTSAQSPPPLTFQDVTSPHHKRMYQLMKDMTEEMGKMTDQMSHDLTPEQRMQMGKRMEAMASMMRRMSGLEAMPAMKEAEQQRQMDEMRTQMDEMMRSSSMRPETK